VIVIRRDTAPVVARMRKKIGDRAFPVAAFRSRNRPPMIASTASFKRRLHPCLLSSQSTDWLTFAMRRRPRNKGRDTDVLLLQLNDSEVY